MAKPVLESELSRAYKILGTIQGASHIMSSACTPSLLEEHRDAVKPPFPH